MTVFRKKCGYCAKKIDKDREVFKDVKVPGFIGTRQKAFCCSEHADSYEEEMEEYMKNSKKCGSSCCR